ncbi:MAG: DUF6082 family protein [Akkermansiaceae bacterium]|jgi:hypothetical protein
MPQLSRPTLKEVAVEITEIVAVVSVFIALVSLTIQQHLTRQERKSDAQTRHYERTQMLLFKALEDPDLLYAISGDSTEAEKQSRFRQLWFNHVEMIFRQRRLFDRVHWVGTMSDVESFLSVPAMRDHWKSNEEYYADDFRKFVNQQIMGQAEATQDEAPPAPLSGLEHASQSSAS